MYVRVEVDNKRQFVKIDNKNDINFQKFVKAVIQKFDIKNAQGKKIYIYDQLETRVDNDDLLKYLIEINAENLVFKVKLSCNENSSDQNELITSNDVEDFLNRNGGSDIISEYGNKFNLNERSRRKLVNLLVDMTISKYGLYPKTFEKVMIAKAAITLFPKFKVDGTQYGTELFFDPPKNSGWLVSVLKARRRRASVRKVPANQTLSESTENIKEYTENDAKNDVEFLRTLVVSKSNMALIEEKLKSTVAYRKQICNDPNINLLERFPYFFTHSELILLYFTNRFGIDPDIFINLWNKSKGNIKDALQLHTTTDYLELDFEEDIVQILLLLKLIPERQKGRKTAAIRLNFTDAIEKLLVFSQNDEPISKSLKDENKQPYIIMKRPSRKEITQYFIVVDGNLLNVDKSFSFVQTFDLLFKTHYSFNLSFDQNLMPFMKFIEHFFYKISKGFTPTNHMIRVHNDVIK